MPKFQNILPVFDNQIYRCQSVALVGRNLFLSLSLSLSFMSGTQCVNKNSFEILIMAACLLLPKDKSPNISK